MKMQPKRSKALSLALTATVVAVLSLPIAAFADEAQDPAVNNEPAAEVAAAPAAANVAEVTKDGAVIGAYSTLEDAIAAATNGGTVTLLGDLSADQVSAGKEKYINITTSGANVTIDLAGHTISLDNMDTISVDASNVNLVVKNGTIVNTNPQSYGLYTYKTNDNINVTLENLTLHTVDQAIGVQGLNTNQNVTLKNCNIKCNTTAVYWPPKSGLLTIEDSYIEGEDGVTIKGGSVVVKGNTHIKATAPKTDPEEYYSGNPKDELTTTGAAVYVESGYNDRDITLDIQGGTFESVNGVSVLYFVKNSESATVDRDIAISGGTFIGEPPAADFVVPGAGLQVDENGNLVAIDAKLVADSTKVENGVHVYDVNNGAIDEAYLLGLMGMNVDADKSGYVLAVDPANLAALNEAIAAKKADATFDFVYTASKKDADAADGAVDPVTITVKLADSTIVPGGDGEGEGGQGTAPSDKPSTGGDKLPATADGSMQFAGVAAAAAGAAVVAAAGAMLIRRKQD